MATQINFGKYKGFTMEELAQAGTYGRSYLAWCMNNLQNPSLRRAAETALTVNGLKVNELALRRLIAVEPDYREFTAEDIEKEVESALEEAERAERQMSYSQSAENRLRSDLRAMGCSDQVISFVMGSLDADAIFTRIKFSSIEKQAAFTAAWNKYEDSLPFCG